MSRDAKQVLTVSRLKNFNRCKRSHQLSYVDLIDTAKTSASLAIGTAIHKGLEVYLWTKDLSRAISAMKKSADLPPYLEAEVICLLTCYIKNYENDGIEILDVELEFSMPLINPDTQRPSRKYTLGGKIDAIVKLPNGEIWLMEHKSTTFSIGIGDPYWDKLILDEQISLYIPAARHYGYEVQVAYRMSSDDPPSSQHWQHHQRKGSIRNPRMQLVSPSGVICLQTKGSLMRLLRNIWRDVWSM